MRILFAFIFILITHLVSAGENYIQYHKDIVRCEEHFIFKNDVAAAIDAYKKVFTNYKKPFAKDCFIALQLATVVKDKAGFEFFACKGFENGMVWGALERSLVVKNYLSTDDVMAERLRCHYERDSIKFWKAIDKGLRAEMFAMKNADDSLKMKGQGMGINDPERIKRHEEYVQHFECQCIKACRAGKVG